MNAAFVVQLASLVPGQVAPGPDGPPKELIAFGVILLAVFGVLALLGLAIYIFVLYKLSSCFARIPPPFRQMEPGQVWLLLIPCFNIVWNFFVYQKLSDSYKSYFNATGRYEVGDCGKAIGLAYCICTCCSLIPYLGILPAIAALVLLIIYVVKALSFKAMIPENAAAAGFNPMPGYQGGYPPKGL